MNNKFKIDKHDQTRMVKSLAQSLGRYRDGKLSKQGAVRALEDCAVLILENRLPNTCDHESLVGLLESTLGVALDSFDSATTISIKGAEGEELGTNLSLVRGVVLYLDSDGYLLSIDIAPSKIKERKALLTIVGVGRDTEPDVAERHDDYLAGINVDGSP